MRRHFPLAAAASALLTAGAVLVIAILLDRHERPIAAPDVFRAPASEAPRPRDPEAPEMFGADPRRMLLYSEEQLRREGGRQRQDQLRRLQYIPVEPR